MVGGVAKIGDGCIWTRVFCQDGVSVQGFEEWVCVAVGLAFDWSTISKHGCWEREERGMCGDSFHLSAFNGTSYMFSLIRSYRRVAGRARIRCGILGKKFGV